MTAKKTSDKRTERPEGLPTVERLSRNVTRINLHVKSTADSDSAWVLLSSDRHHDNPKCLWDLEKKHLDEAVERNAVFVDYGDLFCAMQGRFDRRSSKEDLRPEHQKGDYLDALVRTAADFYGPYAHNFAVVGPGNHETAILKHHETNLTERFIERMNTEYGSSIQLGGYSGWIIFRVCYGQRAKNATGPKKGPHDCLETSSVNLWYHHGYGGDAPVTKGVLQTARQSVYVPDANIVATGHTHNEWIFPIPRIRLKNTGTVYHDEQLHIKTPGYKEEYKDGYGGWHIERGGPPKPNGSIWLKFNWCKSSDQGLRGPRYEALRAK